MAGDPGPYVSINGPDIWVPRTVPYIEARRIAKQGMDEWHRRLVYVGKSDAELLGFSRDCRCDEQCELANRCRTCKQEESWCECTVSDPEDWDICRAPAWHFRSVER